MVLTPQRTQAHQEQRRQRGRGKSGKEGSGVCVVVLDDRETTVLGCVCFGEEK